jgi:hypothetical protein
VIATTIIPIHGEVKPLTDRLLRYDVVVVGRVVSITAASRTTTSTCEGRSTSNSVGGLDDVTVAIEQSVLGSVDQAQITITVLTIDDRRALTNARVIVAGNYMCSDSWRLWGTMIWLDGERVRELKEFATPLTGVTEGAPVTSSVMLTRLRSRSSDHALAALRSATTVILATVATTHMLAPGEWLANVHVVRPLLGQRNQDSLWLRPSTAMECRRYPVKGDTLVLFAPPPTDTLRLSACYDRLLVQAGYIPVLGIPYEAISRRVETAAKGLRLRDPGHGRDE